MEDAAAAFLEGHREDAEEVGAAQQERSAVDEEGREGEGGTPGRVCAGQDVMPADAGADRNRARPDIEIVI